MLALEVSRLARNNADWYRLLDLAGMTDTLIADADGIYHPGLFNDRMLLGMKGTMSEAELHILRARLDGGIRNKAARGELRRGLPVGLVWGEADGEIRWHPDEAVTGVIAAIFERFAVCGSARGVWLWLREQGLNFPLQPAGYLRGEEITWVEPTYHAVHNVLTHPAYAGAYVFGKTRQRRQRRRRTACCAPAATSCRRASGRCSSPTITAGSSTGTPTRPTRPASAPTPARGRTSPAPARSGRAARCCKGWPPAGRAAASSPSTTTGRRKSTPGYYCTGTGQLVEGRGTRHLRVGGVAIDAAVAARVPGRARSPPRCRPAWPPPQQLEDGHDTALAQWRRQVEQARYHAGQGRAPLPGRRPRQPAGRPRPGNRVEHRAATAGRRRGRTRPPRGRAPENPDPARETAAILALGDDLAGVWSAATTTDKDRKQLLRTLLDEVGISVHRDHDQGRADLVLRWKGGAITELSVPLKRKPPQRLRTDEDTIDLLRRLAVHYPDATIAGILNRQHRRTARGLSFTASRVQSLRHHWNIPCHQPGDRPAGRRAAHRGRRRRTNSASPRPPCTAG